MEQIEEKEEVVTMDMIITEDMVDHVQVVVMEEEMIIDRKVKAEVEEEDMEGIKEEGNMVMDQKVDQALVVVVMETKVIQNLVGDMVTTEEVDMDLIKEEVMDIDMARV